MKWFLSRSAAVPDGDNSALVRPERAKENGREGEGDRGREREREMEGGREREGRGEGGVEKENQKHREREKESQREIWREGERGRGREGESETEQGNKDVCARVCASCSGKLMTLNYIEHARVAH